MKVKNASTWPNRIGDHPIIIFGLGRLPEVGGALGRGDAGVRKAQSELEELTQPVEAEKPEEK